MKTGHQRICVRGFSTVVLMFACVSSAIAQYPSRPTVVLKTTSGTTFEGKIANVEYERLSIQIHDVTRELEFEQIASIRFENASEKPANHSVVKLVDGSLLNAETFSIESAELKALLDCGVRVVAGTRDVQWLQFKSFENDLALGKQWRQILDDKSRIADAIVVNRSDELDTVEGVAGDLVDGKLSFSIEDRTARVALAKMQALLFYRAAGRDLGSPAFELRLIDDSSLRVRKIEVNDKGFVCTCVCGLVVDVGYEFVSQLNFSLGRNVSLSSLEPATNDWQPLITSSAIFEKLRKLKLARTNQAFSGVPLSLRFPAESGLSYLETVKQFEEGFSIQGGGKLAFSLNGQYETLTGKIGFDPDASVSGNVRIKIVLEGKTAIDKELIHQTMEAPLEIDLNVKDVDRIVFQVDYNDGRSTGDQLHLVDMKVSQ